MFVAGTVVKVCWGLRCLTQLLWDVLRDPASRPTAKQALKHPWVRRGGAKPTQLSETVVQRIQVFQDAIIVSTGKPHY